MKPEIISSTLKKMIHHKHLGKMLAKKIDDYLYKTIINDESENLPQVQIKRYQLLSAMLRHASSFLTMLTTPMDCIKRKNSG